MAKSIAEMTYEEYKQMMEENPEHGVGDYIDMRSEVEKEYERRYMKEMTEYWTDERIEQGINELVKEGLM